MLWHIRLHSSTIMVVVPHLELQPVLVREQRPHQEDDISVEVSSCCRDRALKECRRLLGAQSGGHGLLEEQLGPLFHAVPGRAPRISHLIRVDPGIVIRRYGCLTQLLQQLRVLQKSFCPLGHQLGTNQLQQVVQRLALSLPGEPAEPARHLPVAFAVLLKLVNQGHFAEDGHHTPLKPLLGVLPMPFSIKLVRSLSPDSCTCRLVARASRNGAERCSIRVRRIR